MSAPHRPLAGIALMPGFGEGTALEWAMALPPLSAAPYACYQLLTRRVAQRDGPVASLFYVSVMGAGISCGSAPWHSHPPPCWRRSAMPACSGRC